MRPWYWMVFLVAGGAGGAAAAQPSAFPSTPLVRHGYDGAVPNDTCCGSFLAGWAPGGVPVTFTSSWLPDEGAFRYALEIQQPGGALPKELFSVRFFRGDDSLPFACGTGADLSSCAWNAHSAKIRGAFVRAKVQPAKEQPLLALPPFEFEWISDAPSDWNDVPFSFGDSAGVLRFRMVDTDAVALHLLPVGLLRVRSPHGRLLVFRLARREVACESMQDMGVRFMRLPDPSAPGRTR